MITSADPGLEADQHGLGNEVGHEAETQRRGEHEQGAHHQREQRRRLQQCRRITARAPRDSIPSR